MVQNTDLGIFPEILMGDLLFQHHYIFCKIINLTQIY